ncbi:CAP domain-containing protein [Flavobacterium sp.]|uniref:CAP domain-containing protein n=1 Tax=Flavobacterium sp. TaxID=239 RepID=UPI002FDA9F9E
MKLKMFKILLPLAMVFTMVSCNSDASETTSTNKTLVTTYNYNDTELNLVAIINTYRQSIGLNSLEVINHISYKCEEHNQYMIANNVVNHEYFQDRVDNLVTVLNAQTVAENIAYNYSSAAAVLNAWLNSPIHKQNIEGDFTNFGLAVTPDPETGKNYFTCIFIKK